MDQHDPIIPARFNHRDAAAGLRSLEQTGEHADALAHAADSAAARFQRAREAIGAASRGYLDLGQSTRSVGVDDPDEPASGAGEPRDAVGLRPGPAGSRSSNHETSSPGEPGDPQRPGHLINPGGRATMAPRGIEPASADRTPRPEGSSASPSAAESASRDSARSVEEAAGRGDRGNLGLADAAARSRRPGAMPEGSPHRTGADCDPGGLSGRRGNPAVADERNEDFSASTEPDPATMLSRPASPPARTSSPDLAGSTNEEGRPGREQLFNSRSVAGTPVAGVPGRGSRALGLEDDSLAGPGAPGADFDAGEAIRKMRSASPASASLASRPAEASASWGQAASAGPSGGRDTMFPSGGPSSGTVIERLLREQNEMIRQDAQRSASPPISAPPPLRGGGLRMGS